MSKKLIVIMLSVGLINSMMGNVFASIVKPKSLISHQPKIEHVFLTIRYFDPLKGYIYTFPKPKPDLYKKEENNETDEYSDFEKLIQSLF